jgi:glycosyltransferase involved in cell wall biosynthesis
VSRGRRAGRLARLINRLKPDVVNSMEFQHGAYLTLEAKARVTYAFPPWMVSNWGSDVFLFSRLEAHKAHIRQVLHECDFYGCECERDVALARQLGLRGRVLPVMPNTGGFDLEHSAALRAPGPTSARRVVMVKGYQHWAGRALVALRALERCADQLAGYTIVIYSASEDVAVAAELLAGRTGLSVQVLPPAVPHQEILALHGQARLSMAASVGDGVSTSFLEALVMGSFPIQSHTSCANEWIEDGVSGFLVPPEDPEHIERAIRRALADDEPVNAAARLNWETACERLDARSIRPRVQQVYRDIVSRRLSTACRS